MEWEPWNWRDELPSHSVCRQDDLYISFRLKSLRRTVNIRVRMAA